MQGLGQYGEERGLWSPSLLKVCKAIVSVPSLDMTDQAGPLQPGDVVLRAETDLEVSRLFVRLLKEGYSVRSRAKGASMAPLDKQTHEVERKCDRGE